MKCCEIWSADYRQRLSTFWSDITRDDEGRACVETRDTAAAALIRDSVNVDLHLVIHGDDTFAYRVHTVTCGRDYTRLSLIGWTDHLRRCVLPPWDDGRILDDATDPIDVLLARLENAEGMLQPRVNR